MIQMEPLKCVLPEFPLDPVPNEQWRSVAVSPALYSAHVMLRPLLYLGSAYEPTFQNVCSPSSTEMQSPPDADTAESKSGDKLHSSPVVVTEPAALNVVSQLEMPRMYICIRSRALHSSSELIRALDKKLELNETQHMPGLVPRSILLLRCDRTERYIYLWRAFD